MVTYTKDTLTHEVLEKGVKLRVRDKEQDLWEAIQSIARAIEMIDEDRRGMMNEWLTKSQTAMGRVNNN